MRALDLDQVAVDSAKLNVKLNKVHHVVTVMQNNLLDHIDQTANVIVANILAEIILRFIDDAYRLLEPNGYFITSGIIQTKKQAVKDGLVNAGFTIEETLTMEDWVAFIARKA